MSCLESPRTRPLRNLLLSGERHKASDDLTLQRPHLLLTPPPATGRGIVASFWGGAALCQHSPA